MKTYLVGGAVRDKLLGLPVLDRDWVVVGETPASMLAAGYTPVGKDFPVFLHPETHEEYALARTERKTGPGYQGFQFNTDESVTLEDDLLRRDLTINAIAEDHTGALTDPFDGQKDINDRVLRHVSPAFAEDPVRVLRIAKFMARFSHLDFDVAPATLSLIHSMVDSGEIDNLVPERVWKELDAALGSTTPRAFFTTLQNANALAPVMKELDQALQRSVNENNASPMLDALDAACDLSDETRIRFAALCTGFTPEYAHCLEGFCQRLRVPSAFAELALLAARFATQTHQAMHLNAIQTHALLKSLDAARRPERFGDFLIVSEAHAQAVNKTTQLSKTTPAAHDDYSQAAHLQRCAKAMGSINAGHIAKSEPNKSTISTVIKQHEVAAIENYLSSLR